MHYSIIGSALSGNKGASAMLESSIQSITKLDPKATFTLFSMYPSEDRRLNEFKNLEIIDASPLKLGLGINSLALIHKILPPLRPVIRKQSAAIRALKKSDRLLDQMGISFSDGREKFLIYNVAAVLPAMLLKVKVVKCAQALGPFKNPINTMVSKLFLPRFARIITRGRITQQFTDELGLKNTLQGVDSAFALKLTEGDKAPAFATLIKGYKSGGKKVVGVSPSVVVEKKYDSDKPGAYLELMRGFIAHLKASGYYVLIVPHSVRTGVSATQNNDLPLCTKLFESIEDKKDVGLLDHEISSQQLRRLIENCDFFVTSRFHAMVSSLAVATAPLVIGWSHKYEEVIELFDAREMAIAYKGLELSELNAKFDYLAKNQKTIVGKIRKALPGVIARADKQILEVLEA